MAYDDEAVLTRYVWDNYQSLMTEFERRVGLAIIARQKAASSDAPLAELLNERWAGQGDSEMELVLADGADAFRRLVCRRLLLQPESEVIVNRCPRCNRIVRTPLARQCFWCGFDWH